MLSISFPAIVAAFGTTGAFGFYAGLNVCAFIMIFLFGKPAALSLDDTKTMLTSMTTSARDQAAYLGGARLHLRRAGQPVHLVPDQKGGPMVV